MARILTGFAEKAEGWKAGETDAWKSPGINHKVQVSQASFFSKNFSRKA